MDTPNHQIPTREPKSRVWKRSRQGLGPEFRQKRSLRTFKERDVSGIPDVAGHYPCQKTLVDIWSFWKGFRQVGGRGWSIIGLGMG